MHELSIAESIFRIAGEKIKEYPGKKPVKINLEIGTLSGIDYEALDFAISSVIKGTPFENTDIDVDRIAPLAKCETCQHEFVPDDYLTSCPECGNFMIRFIRGKELLIRSIEMEEEET